MWDPEQSTDRRPADYFLFALGFIGFLTAAAGMVLASPGLAWTGGILFVLVVLLFRFREPADAD